MRFAAGFATLCSLLFNFGKQPERQGSIVMMFQSQYATNYWPSTGKVYNPPSIATGASM
jgi:hypothetical protein